MYHKIFYFYLFVEMILIMGTQVCVAQKSLDYAVDASLTCAFNTFSENWSGSSIGSFIWISNFKGTVKYALNKNLYNVSMLRFGFGQIIVQDKNTKNWQPPSTCSDFITVESMFNFDPSCRSFRFITFRAESRFRDDKHHPLNPLAISGIFGVSTTIISSKKLKLSMNIGGSILQSIDCKTDNYNPVTGQNETKRIESSTGNIEFTTEFSSKQNPFLHTECKFFMNQALVNSRKNVDNAWRYPDFKIDLMINVPVVSFFNVSYSMLILYDKEISTNIRYKQIIGAGLKIKF